MLLHRSSRIDDRVGDVLASWLAGVGTSDPLLREAGTDLVAAVLRHAGAPVGALRRFGQRVGAAGWRLADVSRWIDLLAGITDADALRSFEAGTALGQGWADGFLHGSATDGVLDPLTGFVTPAVLRMRLGEIHDQCTALDIAARDVYAVVVVDADVQRLPHLLRDSAIVLLGDCVREQFGNGETIARTGARVLVAASRTPALADRVALLGERLASYPLLIDAGAQAWVEELPERAAAVDAFVLDLAC